MNMNTSMRSHFVSKMLVEIYGSDNTCLSRNEEVFQAEYFLSDKSEDQLRLELLTMYEKWCIGNAEEKYTLSLKIRSLARVYINKCYRSL